MRGPPPPPPPPGVRSPFGRCPPAVGRGGSYLPTPPPCLCRVLGCQSRPAGAQAGTATAAAGASTAGRQAQGRGEVEGAALLAAGPVTGPGRQVCRAYRRRSTHRPLRTVQAAHHELGASLPIQQGTHRLHNLQRLERCTRQGIEQRCLVGPKPASISHVHLQCAVTQVPAGLTRQRGKDCALLGQDSRPRQSCTAHVAQG